MNHCLNISSHPPSLKGIRTPRGLGAARANGTVAATCDAGFCAGATRCYPTTEGLVWYAEFDVPPLPTSGKPADQFTDYIYFNIFFGYGNDHDNPNYPACLPDKCSGDGHGRFNQFVPQVSALACYADPVRLTAVAPTRAADARLCAVQLEQRCQRPRHQPHLLALLVPPRPLGDRRAVLLR
jgi:hypothetical protein